MNIREAQQYQFYKRFKLLGILILTTFSTLVYGVKVGNIISILISILSFSAIVIITFSLYKKDAEKEVYLNYLKLKKYQIEKNLKMNDREILLLTTNENIPPDGFKNIISVNTNRKEIFWIADLPSEVNEKYLDFILHKDYLEAVTSNNYRVTIHPDTGKIIYSRISHQC